MVCTLRKRPPEDEAAPVEDEAAAVGGCNALATRSMGRSSGRHSAQCSSIRVDSNPASGSAAGYEQPNDSHVNPHVLS